MTALLLGSALVFAEVLGPLIEGIGYEHFEGLFQTGPLECAIYGFEKALMFHFPTGAFTGLFVSVDRDRELDIDTIIDICTKAIRRTAEEE